MVAGPGPVHQPGRRARRYRPSFAGALKAAGANVYVHSLGDPIQIQRFWDLGICGRHSSGFSRCVVSRLATRNQRLVT